MPSGSMVQRRVGDVDPPPAVLGDEVADRHRPGRNEPTHLVEVRLERDAPMTVVAETPLVAASAAGFSIQATMVGRWNESAIQSACDRRPPLAADSTANDRAPSPAISAEVYCVSRPLDATVERQFGQRHRTELGILRRLAGQGTIESSGERSAWPPSAPPPAGRGDGDETDPDRVGERSSDRGCWRVLPATVRRRTRWIGQSARWSVSRSTGDCPSR